MKKIMISSDLVLIWYEYSEHANADWTAKNILCKGLFLIPKYVQRPDAIAFA